MSVIGRIRTARAARMPLRRIRHRRRSRLPVGLVMTVFTAFTALGFSVLTAGTALASSVGDSAANIARSQLGYHEANNGSGCNQFTYALYGPGGNCPSGTSNRGSYEWQWCSDFATWVWSQAGADISGLTSASASFYAYGRNHGTWHASGSGYVPQPGDAIVYDLNSAGTWSSHVGIVVSTGKSSPDVVQGNFAVNGLWSVYMDTNNHAATSIDGYRVSGYATPVAKSGGNSGGGASTPAIGQVLGSGSQATHIGPSGATAAVVGVPAGTVVSVDCTVSGQAVTGPYGTETVWDRTDYAGAVGFIPDAWVYTGSNAATAAPCGGNGVAIQPGCLPIHTAASNASAALGCVPQATTVSIDCTAHGDSNSGPYGATTLWDHMNYNGARGYVTDAYIYTGTDNAIAGACPALPEPRVTSASVPNGVVGRGFDRYLSVIDGAGPYTWQLSAGSLPKGLTLTPDGHLVGRPSKAGTYGFTARALDSESPQRAAQRRFTITIAPRLFITTDSLPHAVKRHHYRLALHASGGTGERSWSIASGHLPRGLSLSSSGAIRGQAKTTGKFTFTVRVVDELQPADVATRTLRIRVHKR